VHLTTYSEVFKHFVIHLRGHKPTVLTRTIFVTLLVTWCTERFNIQGFYALPTLYLFVLYLSEDKQRLVPLTS